MSRSATGLMAVLAGVAAVAGSATNVQACGGGGYYSSCGSSYGYGYSRPYRVYYGYEPQGYGYYGRYYRPARRSAVPQQQFSQPQQQLAPERDLPGDGQFQPQRQSFQPRPQQDFRPRQPRRPQFNPGQQAGVAPRRPQQGGGGLQIIPSDRLPSNSRLRPTQGRPGFFDVFDRNNRKIGITRG